MSEKNIRANDNSHTLPEGNIRKVVALGNGNAALLYLHILKEGALDKDKAVKELPLSLKDVDKAAEALSSVGIACDTKPLLLPADEEKRYSVAEILNASSSDSAFSGLISEIERRRAQKLSISDVEMFFGIYNGLGMPPEVIMLLYTHCVEEYYRKYNDGRKPTMKYIEKEAYSWANLGILTAERAEEHLRRRSENQSKTAGIKKILQIRNRDLSKAEDKCAASWLEMGFDLDAIELAYERMIIKTHDTSIPYMDSILRSWHSKGLHNINEIELKDKPGNSGKWAGYAPSNRQRQEPVQTAPSLGDAERVLRALAKAQEMDSEDTVYGSAM